MCSLQSLLLLLSHQIFSELKNKIFLMISPPGPPFQVQLQRSIEVWKLKRPYIEYRRYTIHVRDISLKLRYYASKMLARVNGLTHFRKSWLPDWHLCFFKLLFCYLRCLLLTSFSLSPTVHKIWIFYELARHYICLNLNFLQK